LIVQWIHSFIDHCENPTIQSGNYFASLSSNNGSYEFEPQKHSLFYFAAQAIFYIICFKHKQLLTIEGNFTLIFFFSNSNSNN